MRLHSCLSLSLGEHDELHAPGSYTTPLPLRERSPVAYWVGAWVASDPVWTCWIKNLLLLPGFEPPDFPASRLVTTDYAIPAPSLYNVVEKITVL